MRLERVAGLRSEGPVGQTEEAMKGNERALGRGKDKIRSGL